MQFLSASRRKAGERRWGTRKPGGCSWVQGWWQVYVQVLKVHEVWQEGILTAAWRRFDDTLKIHLSSWWWLIKSGPPRVSSDVLLTEPKEAICFWQKRPDARCGNRCLPHQGLFRPPCHTSLRRCLAEFHAVLCVYAIHCSADSVLSGWVQISWLTGFTRHTTG